MIETITNTHEFNKGLKAFFDGFIKLEHAYIRFFETYLLNDNKFKYKRLAIVAYLACCLFFGFIPMLLLGLIIFCFLILATFLYIVLKEV